MNRKLVDIAVAVACVLAFVGANLALFASDRFPVVTHGVTDWTATVGLIAATFITFAMFSFLYKDNPLFRAVENLFVGLGLGVSFYIIWFSLLKPNIFDTLVVPALDPAVSVAEGDWLLLVPIALGLMMLTRISRNYGWISRYPIAFIVGYGSGFLIQPVIHSLILKQVEVTMRPVQMHLAAWIIFGFVALAFIAGAFLASKGGRLGLALKIAAGVVTVVYVILSVTPALTKHPEIERAFAGADSMLLTLGVVSVLCYFFFSAEHKGALGAFSRVGVIFLMISFGASFGYAVMARESLVIGRFQFLLDEWLQLL
jgi:hypothetical protein